MHLAPRPSGLVEPELALLRRLADELAQRRREEVSTAHLLAAVVVRPGAASELLRERKLLPEDILRGARTAADGAPDTVRRVLERARGIGARMGATHTTPEHVLIALLNERKSAARSVIEAAGFDPGRLRALAMSLGQGLVARRPAAEERSERIARGDTAMPGPAAPLAAPKPKGVTIPLYPPEKKERTRKAPAASVAVQTAMTDDPNSSHTAPADTPSLAARAESTRGFELDAKRFPTLSGLGKNLTRLAEFGKLDPVVGREQEMDAVLDVLAKRHANNPCLIGPSGVGKTSIVRGLATRLAAGAGHDEDRVLVDLPISDLLAGTGVRGALATRFQALQREVKESAGRVVLFLDDLDQLLASEAGDEIAGDFRQALSQGSLPCIGATTDEGLRRILARDPALGRCFTPVQIEEPSREDAYLILDTARSHLESHHHVTYQKEALALAVSWSVRYLPSRALPDKALSVMDAAGARVRRRRGKQVTPEHIAEVVSSLADVPVERLIESDGDRMLRLERILGERIVGHAEHLGRIARILRRSAAGFASTRPIGTFLLLGPTGVGKTETAKAIAEVLFHDERAMTRLDLSEFSESHAVARLIGAPPGYVGHEAGGQLTEAVRQRPYQVILLDELEKAHPDVLTLFLGVFDEGRLTDGRGRTLDFSNTVILMTSNLGCAAISGASRRRLGFGQSAGDSMPDDRDVEKLVLAAARGALSPELYNRIDEVLVFLPLAREEVRLVAERLLAKVERGLVEKYGIRLQIEDAVFDALLDAGGFDQKLGARPMKRTIARLIEGPLAEKILGGEVRQGDVVLVHAEGSTVVFDVLGAEAAARLAEDAAE